MTIKKHHKIIIGSFTTLVIIFMITVGILLNGIIVKQNLNHNELKNKISEVQTDTQSKLNELTQNLLQTKSEVKNLNNKIGNINQEFDLLKASVSADFSGVVEESIKSVVTIITDVGQGTGFLITEEGYLITNAHVLSGANSVYVLNFEQQQIKTSLIGYNSDYFEIIKIEGDYSKLILGNSDKTQIGEKVIAIGNPLGLQFSVTEGIVSGTHRIGINNVEAYIQTDAALNPGNSGGPLINKQGEVIGINNFKISGGESLGFALESNYIKEIVNEISQQILEKELI